jgi:hypothetical protein
MSLIRVRTTDWHREESAATALSRGHRGMLLRASTALADPMLAVTRVFLRRY